MRTLTKTLFLLLALLLLPACQSGPTTPHAEQPPAAAQLSPEQQDDLDGQLILAAYAADLPEVERLLAAGADPDARAGERAELWFGETHEGRWYGPMGSREWTPLLACFSNVNNYGDEHDLYPVCVALLDAGADLNTADSHGSTALYSAIRGRDTASALLLIRRGADINTVTEIYIDAPEGSPLWLAIRNENRPVVSALIAAGVEIDSDEVMWQAVKSRDGWMTASLILAGADVNVTRTAHWGPDRDSRYVYTPLIAAIIEHPNYWENPNIRILIEDGATLGDLSQLDHAYVLRHAIPDAELVRYLVDQGLSPTAVSRDGDTPLHDVATAYHYDDGVTTQSLYVMLQVEGLDVDVLDPDGRAPLYYALREGKLDIIEMLLEAGADPDLMAGTEDNYLHLAVPGWTTTPLALLLDYGADPLATDGFGVTAMEVAEGFDPEVGDIYIAMLRAAIAAREAEAE